MYDIRNPKWCFGTCGQRVAAVQELAEGCYQNGQQLLYEIAFCDPIKDVRLAAVYYLNRMWSFEPIMCYQKFIEDEFYPEYLTPPVKYHFFSSGYGDGYHDRRASVIPYIEKQALLRAIVMHDNEDSVVISAAQMLELPEDLEQAYRFAPCSTAGRLFIGAQLRERREGRPAKFPLLPAEPDTKDSVIPPKCAPSFEELRSTAWRICCLRDGEYSAVTARETEIAITALVELEDIQQELKNALNALFLHPDFQHRDILKRYDGIKIRPALERGPNGFREDAGRFYLPRKERTL